MDLGGWLRSLGLERYEAAFRENEIDDMVLPNLTAVETKWFLVEMRRRGLRTHYFSLHLRISNTCFAPIPKCVQCEVLR